MIPGSLDDGTPLNPGGVFRRFKGWVRRYLWLRIASRTVKGITTTTTVVWMPLACLYLSA